MELADLLLSSAANQMQTQLQVAEIWGRNHYRACHDYLAFAHAQQLQAQAGRHRSRIRTAIAPNAPVAPSEVVTPIFPEWEAIPDNTLMGVPSAKALESYVQHAYECIYPELYKDLIRRSPGRFMCSDGTFKLAKITMSEGRVLILFIGEDTTICGFYVVQSESWENLEV
jgi:hypothetical protein